MNRFRKHFLTYAMGVLASLSMAIPAASAGPKRPLRPTKKIMRKVPAKHRIEQKAKLSGEIPGFRYLKVIALPMDWDKDGSKDGLQIDLRYFDQDKRKIKFEGVQAQGEVRVFSFTPKGTRGRMLFEKKGIAIQKSNDLLPMPKDEKAPNAIPYSQISVRPGKDARQGIIEFTLHTARQGSKKAVFKANIYQAEKGKGPKLPFYGDYGPSPQGQVRGLSQVGVGGYASNWEGDRKHDGIKLSVDLLDENGQHLKPAGTPIKATVTMYDLRPDGSRYLVQYTHAYQFSDTAGGTLTIPWKEMKCSTYKKKCKRIVEAKVLTPKQGEFITARSSTWTVK